MSAPIAEQIVAVRRQLQRTVLTKERAEWRAVLATLESVPAMLATIEAARAVHDRFAGDIAKGYVSRDKRYAAPDRDANDRKAM